MKTSIRLVILYSAIIFMVHTFCVYSYVVPTGLTVVHSSPTELKLLYKPTILGYDTSYSNNGEMLIFPKIKDAYPLNNVNGEAIRLGIRIPVAVPDDKNWKITNQSIGKIQCITEKVIPINRVALDSLHPQNKLEITPVYYQPLQQWVDPQYSGIARNKHIVFLQIVVVQYNVETQSINIPSEISVTLQFAPTSVNKQNTVKTKDFSLAINHDESNSWSDNVPLSFSKKGVELLQDKISSGTWIKIQIDQEGVYKIDKDQLSKLGVVISKEDVNTVKILGFGGKDLPEQVIAAESNIFNEQHITVRTTNDGNFEDVVFYASGASGFSYNSKLKRIEHFINHFTTSNYYLLTWGGRVSKSFSKQESPSGTAVNFPNKYIARLFHEDELVNPYGAGSGKRYFGQQIDESLPRTYTTQLPNLLRSGEVEYRIAVAHKVVLPTGMISSFTIDENSNALGVMTLRGINSAGSGYEETVSKFSKFMIPASKVASDNRSILKIKYDNPSANNGSFGYLDYFEIHYPAQLIPMNNELEFFTDFENQGLTEINVNGYGGAIYGFNVSDRNNPRLVNNTSSTGGMFIFKTQVSDVPERYFISSNLRTPQISVLTFNNLRESYNQSDMIVITPSEFRASAEEYKAYREAKSGLKVFVANTEDIFASFSSTIPDPTAIRDFIAHTFKYAVKPKYILLWGDGHFDYKNILTKRKNYVTTWQTDDVETSYDYDSGWDYTDSYTSDDYFVRVIGEDGMIDAAIGRLPIDSKETALLLLNKIRHYETKSSVDNWRANVTLVADDGPTSGGGTDSATHTRQSEEIATSSYYLSPDFIEKKIYMVEYPVENIPKGRRKPRVTEDLLSNINNKGSVILNWIGHGNPHVWAHEAIYERDVTTSQFSNYDKLFFLVAATCDFARFDMLETQSGAEAFVLSDRGGAIAAFSSSRVVFSGWNSELAKALYSEIFTRDGNGNYRSIGEIIFDLKQVKFGINDQKFFLLGDPAIHLLIPDYVAKIDSINGQFISNKDTLKISALSDVRVSGSILKYGSNVVENNFNGSATLSMFDSDVHLQVQDPSAVQYGDVSIHYIEKLGGALHKGNYQVNGGKFNAQFVVPKDISFINDRAHLFAYARSDDNRFAKGVNSNFKVSGVATTSVVDELGPTMNIFLDARTFKPYDVVRSNPLLIVDLKDETGINTTAIGVGHKIEAWFDDENTSTDLTDYFSTSLTDSKQGSAIKQVFGFAPGEHKVRVRAWDIYNNFTEATTYFNVGQNDSNVISSRITVYPNPFADNTTIFFTHNQGFPFNVNLDIFTLNGVKVRSFVQKTSGLQSGSFNWDGRDEQGSSLSQGIYVFLLSFAAPDGTIQTVTGKIILLRN